MKRCFYIFFPFLLICSIELFAEESEQQIEFISDSSETKKIDSLKFESLEALMPEKVESGKFQMQKSPMGAIWRSLVFPGWGQIYVESYWKAPLFIGATGTLVYLIISNHNNFQLKVDELSIITKEDPTNPSISLLKRQREFYRDNRDQSAFFLLGVYVLATVDAYVGAHLFDFDVSDDLTLKFVPNQFGGISAVFKLQILK